MNFPRETQPNFCSIFSWSPFDVFGKIDLNMQWWSKMTKVREVYIVHVLWTRTVWCNQHWVFFILKVLKSIDWITTLVRPASGRAPLKKRNCCLSADIGQLWSFLSVELHFLLCLLDLANFLIFWIFAIPKVFVTCHFLVVLLLVTLDSQKKTS